MAHTTNAAFPPPTWLPSLPLMVIAFLGCLLFLPNLSQADNNVNTTEAPLDKKFGYLLIQLDVGGTAPSLQYSRYSDSRKRGKSQSLKLKTHDQEFLMVPLAKGNYRVEHIEAPMYDFPYKKDTKQETTWRFTVQEQKVNYFGKLTIHPEREQHYVEIQRSNNIGELLFSKREALTSLIGAYELVTATPFRDDFYPYYTEEAKQ